MSPEKCSQQLDAIAVSSYICTMSHTAPAGPITTTVSALSDALGALRNRPVIDRALATAAPVSTCSRSASAALVAHQEPAGDRPGACHGRAGDRHAAGSRPPALVRPGTGR